MINLGSTNAQVEFILMPLLYESLNNTMERCLDKLKYFIEMDVYSYDFNDTNDMPWQNSGARTGQFEQSWEVTRQKLAGTLVSAMLEQDDNLMIWMKDTFQHGSDSKLGEGALAEIINSGHVGNAFGFNSSIGARPFLKHFEKWMDSNFYNIFRIEAGKVGIKGTMA